MLFSLAIATLDFKRDGKVGVIGVAYIVALNLGCAIIGTVCALLIQPGILALLGIFLIMRIRHIKMDNKASFLNPFKVGLMRQLVVKALRELK